MKPLQTLIFGATALILSLSAMGVGQAYAAENTFMKLQDIEGESKAAPTREEPKTLAPAGREQQPGRTIPSKFIDLVPLAPNPAGPLPGAPNSGFCGSNQGGGVAKQILTSVKNNGNTAAGTFTNKVVFPNADPADRVQEDSYIDAGPGFMPAKIFFVIPPSAWKNGKADFEFVVDSKNEVKENNEINNTYNGYCVEPAM